MKANKGFLFTVWVLVAASAFAEELTSTNRLIQGETGAIAEEAPEDQPKGKPGFVRFWYFAEPNQPAVGAFALRNQQETEVALDHWICRKMPPGFLASFNPIPAGTYFLQVQTEDESPITFSPDGNAKAVVSSEKALLKSPVEFTVAPSSYHTICLISQNGSLSAKIFPESGFTPEQRKLRIFNFVGESAAEIQSIDAGAPKKVGDAGVGSVTEFPVSSSSTSANYLIKIPEKNGKIRSYSLEVNHGESQVSAIAIFRDRYGRMTAQPADGAPFVKSLPQ